MDTLTEQKISNRLLLRRATSAEHAAAERVWIGETGFYSAESYRQFLSILLQIHVQFGAPATHALSSDDTEASRIDALMDDLDCQAPDIAGVPVTTDQAWGVCYVLNGSAMGASLLLKSGTVAADWPSSYLRVMRDYAKSGALAKFFRDLDRQCLDEAAAIDGASQVFQAISAHGDPSSRQAWT